jgi:hypothetical protein
VERKEFGSIFNENIFQFAKSSLLFLVLREEIPVVKEQEERPKKPPRVVADRWLHDRYDERQQGPKSEEELVAMYGYNIRNGETAPRARRRRRYG